MARVGAIAEQKGLSNVTPVLTTQDAVVLPPSSVDVAFICDVYHHFEYPAASLASLYRSLRPGGQLVLIDFERIPGVSSDWTLGHVRAGKLTFRGEIETAGFRFAEEVDVAEFEENYFLRFEKPAAPDPEPGGVTRADRPLGVFSLTALVAASMVGAGVFTTSGFLLADLGDARAVLAAWVVGGAIAVLGAISYGQLAERLTQNGGEYLHLAASVHPAAGFIAGWVSLLAGFTSAAAYAAISLQSYAMPGGGPDGLPPHALAWAIVAIATILHLIPTRRGAGTQAVIVAVKLGLLVTFVAVAVAASADWKGAGVVDAPERSGAGRVAAFATALTWISLSYSGFNAAIYVAGEARGGAAAVGRAMVLATLAIGVLYLLLNAVFLYAPPAAAVAGQEQIAAIAARAVGGGPLAGLVRVVICVGLATSVSAAILAGPRVYARMAEDGLMPAVLRSKTSPPTRRGVGSRRRDRRGDPLGRHAVVALVFGHDVDDQQRRDGRDVVVRSRSGQRSAALGASGLLLVVDRVGRHHRLSPPRRSVGLDVDAGDRRRGLRVDGVVQAADASRWLVIVVGCFTVARLSESCLPGEHDSESRATVLEAGYRVRCLALVPEKLDEYTSRETATTIDIGGTDVVTYRSMMNLMTQELGLPRRWILPLPFPSTRLSSRSVDARAVVRGAAGGSGGPGQDPNPRRGNPAGRPPGLCQPIHRGAVGRSTATSAGGSSTPRRQPRSPPFAASAANTDTGAAISSGRSAVGWIRRLEGRDCAVAAVTRNGPG